MMTWSQIGLQDASSPIMEEFIYFHDFAMLILVFIISSVGLVLGWVVAVPYVDKNLLEGQLVECVWTLIPAAVLIQIAIPSLILLYMIDESAHDSMTVKVVGHQWYWSYEYSDFWNNNKNISFDSYVDSSIPRLLDVDSRLVFPFGVRIRAMITSADVLHSWAVPALGVKADACPGRLNQVKFLSHRSGVMFGQCSEICGANHSFMPIGVEFINSLDFSNWIKNSLF